MDRGLGSKGILLIGRRGIYLLIFTMRNSLYFEPGVLLPILLLWDEKVVAVRLLEAFWVYLWCDSSFFQDARV